MCAIGRVDVHRIKDDKKKFTRHYYILNKIFLLKHLCLLLDNTGILNVDYIGD